MMLCEKFLPDDVEDAIVESILLESDSALTGIRTAMALARVNTSCRTATRRNALFQSLASDMRDAVTLYTTIGAATNTVRRMMSQMYATEDSHRDTYMNISLASEFQCPIRHPGILSETYSRWESSVDVHDVFRTWTRLEPYFELVPFGGAAVHVTTESWPVMQPNGKLSEHPVVRVVEFDIRLPDCDIIVHFGNLVDQKPHKRFRWWCQNETPCATMLRNLLEQK